MEIAYRKKVVMCNISYCVYYYVICYAHNDLISDLNLYHIREAIINARAFKFDTNVVVVVRETIGVTSRFLLDSWICNYTMVILYQPPQRTWLDLNWFALNTSQIHFIFTHHIKQLHKVCHMQRFFTKFWNFDFWQIF